MSKLSHEEYFFQCREDMNGSKLLIIEAKGIKCKSYEGNLRIIQKSSIFHVIE